MKIGDKVYNGTGKTEWTIIKQRVSEHDGSIIFTLENDAKNRHKQAYATSLKLVPPKYPPLKFVIADKAWRDKFDDLEREGKEFLDQLHVRRLALKEEYEEWWDREHHYEVMEKLCERNSEDTDGGRC